MRDELFDALVDTVVEYGKGMEIGLVRAVLQEVDGEIARRTGRLPLESIAGGLRKKDCPTDAGTSAGQSNQ